MLWTTNGTVDFYAWAKGPSSLPALSRKNLPQLQVPARGVRAVDAAGRPAMRRCLMGERVRCSRT